MLCLLGFFVWLHGDDERFFEAPVMCLHPGYHVKVHLR